ncbi:hypothetical protein [Plantactinospora soyae]|uniref:Uncharacterized protein n=1 Tax=Plantactinospora soyae TaxID=1544732 RepID=A0A927M050_9ACTN|nr:hypothetical protein [Plantactinospora soyae]MBE1485589.1 hypothetical protein [Plantactinospora soyae]
MGNIEVDLNNPAGRLLWMLEEANKQLEQPAVRVWADIFDVDPTDMAGLMRGIADVAATAADVRTQINALSDDPQIFLMHYGEVERTVAKFPYMGNNHMNWFLSDFRDTGRYCLIHCSTLLTRRQPEPRLVDETIQNLVNEIHSILRAVEHHENLDSELKAFLLRHLLVLKRALEDFHLFGSKPVEQALDEAVGAIGRKPHLVERMRQNNYVSAFIALLLSVDVALGMASNTKALTASPVNPPSPSPAVAELAHRCEIRIIDRSDERETADAYDEFEDWPAPANAGS